MASDNKPDSPPRPQRDIAELDDEAQKLRVLWRKKNNFYSAVAHLLFGDPEVNPKELLAAAGLREEFVLKRLAIHRLVLPAEYRDYIDWRLPVIRREKREALAAWKEHARKERELARKARASRGRANA